MFESEEVVVAIKGYKIIEARQIVMHCDSCGDQMPPGVFKSAPKKECKSPLSVTVDWINSPPEIDYYYYEYTCSRCGNIQKSRNSYPFQQIRFDCSDFIDVEDQGKV